MQPKTRFADFIDPALMLTVSYFAINVASVAEAGRYASGSIPARVTFSTVRELGSLRLWPHLASNQGEWGSGSGKTAGSDQ